MTTEKHPLTLDTLRREHPCGHERCVRGHYDHCGELHDGCPGYSIPAVLAAWEEDRAALREAHLRRVVAMVEDPITVALAETVDDLQTELQRYREALEWGEDDMRRTADYLRGEYRELKDEHPHRANAAAAQAELLDAYAGKLRQALTHNENKEPG